MYYGWVGWGMNRRVMCSELLVRIHLTQVKM